MMRALWGLVLAGAIAFAGAEDEVKAAEKTWFEAVLKRDEAALRRVFAADLIYAHSTGKIETREEYLGRLREGKQRYDTFDYEKTMVRVHGNSAVLHAVVRITGKNDNGPFNDHLMLIHFWVKKKSGWQLVAHQTTRIP